MVKIANRKSQIVILVLCALCLSCKTTKQTTEKTNYQSNINFDSLLLQSTVTTIDWNKNKHIVVEEIRFYKPDSSMKQGRPPQPETIKRAVITTDETAATAIVDTLTTHVTRSGEQTLKTETTVQPSPDPLKWRYIFYIILLICISAYLIYKKFIK